MNLQTTAILTSLQLKFIRETWKSDFSIKNFFEQAVLSLADGSEASEPISETGLTLP